MDRNRPALPSLQRLAAVLVQAPRNWAVPRRGKVPRSSLHLVSITPTALRRFFGGVLRSFSSSVAPGVSGGSGSSFFVLRLVLALVLLLAATLKAYQLATAPVRGMSFFEGRLFMAIAVQVQLALAIWFLGGLQPNWTRRVAIAFFGVLTAVSLFMALRGAETCGCFGNVRATPWATFILGAVTIGALFACPTPTSSAPAPSWRFIAILALSTAVGAPIAVATHAVPLADSRQHSEMPYAVLSSAGTLADASDTASPYQRTTGPLQTFSFPNYASQQSNNYLKAVACGPLSLIAAINAQGVPVSERTRDELIGAAEEQKGVDLLQLQKLASKLGLYTLGIRISTDELRRLQIPAIAHLHGSTFVAVTGYFDGSLEVVYPLEKPALVPYASFDAAFGKVGHVLLLSRQPIDPASIGLPDPSAKKDVAEVRPHVLPSRSAIGLGRLFREDWEASLVLRGAGQSPVQIVALTPSCPSVIASVDHAVLAPGESTVLRVKGRETQVGPFGYQIVLTTDQPDEFRSVLIPVNGLLEFPMLFPKPGARVDALFANEQITLPVPVLVSPDGHGGEVVVDSQADSPFSLISSLDANGQRLLLVHWRGSGKPGWHRHTIRVRPRQPPDALFANLHVAVNVIGEASSSPPSLTVTPSELRSGWSRRVEVTVNRGNAHQLSVAPSDPLLLAAFTVKAEAASEKLLRLSITATGDLPTLSSAQETAPMYFKICDAQGTEVSRVSILAISLHE